MIDWEFFELCTIIGFIIIVPCIVLFLFVSNEKSEEQEWNNGYCQCGGMFEYCEAVGHRTGTTYMYKCNSCGKMIERDNLE